MMMMPFRTSNILRLSTTRPINVSLNLQRSIQQATLLSRPPSEPPVVTPPHDSQYVPEICRMRVAVTRLTLFEAAGVENDKYRRR